MSTRRPAGPQTLIGVGVLAVGAVIAVGAAMLPSEAGYGGVGPNFLPWVVGVVLLVCGALVLWESRSAGGFSNMTEPGGSRHGYWAGFGWMSAALLANAALITTIGFILSCALCFMLAVRGLRNADRQDRPGGFDLVQLLRDAAIGIAISAPVYWSFTKLLAINLPGLTSTGWI